MKRIGRQWVVVVVLFGVLVLKGESGRSDEDLGEGDVIKKEWNGEVDVRQAVSIFVVLFLVRFVFGEALIWK